MSNEIDYYFWHATRASERYKKKLAANFSLEGTESDRYQLGVMGFAVETAMNCEDGAMAPKVADFWRDHQSSKISDFVASLDFENDLSLPPNRLCHYEISAWYVSTKINQVAPLVNLASGYKLADIRGAVKRLGLLAAVGRFSGGAYGDECIPLSFVEREIVHLRFAGVFTNPIFHIANKGDEVFNGWNDQWQ